MKVKQTLLRFMAEHLSSYGFIWSMLSLTEESAAKHTDLDGKDITSWDELGKKHAEFLRSFVKEDAVVLDLGCGAGRVLKHSASYCKELHGVDVSGNMVKLARKRVSGLENVFVHKNNGKDLSLFPNCTFDFVYSLAVLSHLEKEDSASYLVEIHRVLKPKGLCYLEFRNFLSKENDQLFLDYVYRRRPRSFVRIRFSTPDEIRKMIMMANLKVLSLDSDMWIKVVAAKP